MSWNLSKRPAESALVLPWQRDNARRAALTAALSRSTAGRRHRQRLLTAAAAGLSKQGAVRAAVASPRRAAVRTLRARCELHRLVQCPASAAVWLAPRRRCCSSTAGVSEPSNSAYILPHRHQAGVLTGRSDLRIAPCDSERLGDAAGSSDAPRRGCFTKVTDRKLFVIERQEHRSASRQINRADPAEALRSSPDASVSSGSPSCCGFAPMPLVCETASVQTSSVVQHRRRGCSRRRSGSRRAPAARPAVDCSFAPGAVTSAARIASLLHAVAVGQRNAHVGISQQR